MNSQSNQVEGYERELRALYAEFDADADKIDADPRVTIDERIVAGRILRDEFNDAQMLLAIEWGFHV
jgi:hypothetical protein